MLQRMATSPKKTEAPKAIRPMEEELYTIGQVARLLGKSYWQVKSFIRKHNRLYPDAQIVPIQRTITGSTVFIKQRDIGIIREGFEHPENTEKRAWE